MSDLTSMLPRIIVIEEEEKDPTAALELFKSVLYKKGEPDADIPSIVEGPRPDEPFV